MLHLYPARRIIPTYVGSTATFYISITSATNHSHVCGINHRLSRIHPMNNESFPRMWDQRAFRMTPSGYRRIIPTYVGSTTPRMRQNSQWPNHSHVCGINRANPPSYFFYIESFPRMWDQHRYIVAKGLRNRIIPTYVGSTNIHALIKRGKPNHSHVCGINVGL